MADLRRPARTHPPTDEALADLAHLGRLAAGLDEHLWRVCSLYLEQGIASGEELAAALDLPRSTFYARLSRWRRAQTRKAVQKPRQTP